MPTLDPDGVVLFDAVGTLLRPEPSVAEAYAAAGKCFGSLLTRAEIDLRFRTVFADDKQADLRDREGRTDGTRKIQRWHSIVKGVFDDVSPTRVDALFEELWAHFARPENWRVFDDVRPAVDLRNSGQVLAIASNFDERLLEITLSILPEITYEHVLVSSLVGYRKPASGFFRACKSASPISTSHPIRNRSR